MTAPSSDTAGIRQLIRALKEGMFTLRDVNNGEDNEAVKLESHAIELATATDDAWVSFNAPTGEYAGAIYFVLGNSPEEVACDWTISNPEFDAIVNAVVDGWNA